MLSEFQDIESRHGTEKADAIRKAIRYLIRHQFVYSGDRGVAAIYDVLTDERFRGFLDGYFDCIGYGLRRNGEEQWVGILLDDEDFSSAPRMRLDETIVVLVLAAFWQDEANQGNIEDRATAVTTLNTLFERYRDTVAGHGRAALATSQFQGILQSLALRNIVSISDVDRDQWDREVVIRPMIRLIAGERAVDKIEKYVRDEEAATTRSGNGAAPDDEPQTVADGDAGEWNGTDSREDS